VVSFTLRPLCSRGPSPRYLLGKVLIGPQSPSEHCGKQEGGGGILPLPGIEPRSPGLYRLSYMNSIRNAKYEIRLFIYKTVYLLNLIDCSFKAEVRSSHDIQPSGDDG
jgi:hypothetical protein